MAQALKAEKAEIVFQKDFLDSNEVKTSFPTDVTRKQKHEKTCERAAVKSIQHVAYVKENPRISATIQILKADIVFQKDFWILTKAAAPQRYAFRSAITTEMSLATTVRLSCLIVCCGELTRRCKVSKLQRFSTFACGWKP